MKLSQVKALLPTLKNLTFKLEKGTFVPEYFHVTEIGMVTKNFIDCGGTIRNEKTVNFQLWNDNDLDHSLKPIKLLNIIELSERQLDIEDTEIEVEYQDDDTIGKYSLAFDGNNFILRSKTTVCLANDKCGVSQKKQRTKLEDTQSACCTVSSESIKSDCDCNASISKTSTTEKKICC
ncbi:hypothetical protein BEN44_20065 [Leptospira interrogans serovar Ricardi]|uniref:DUF6428 family protein n=1 Tax=Leptospira interrogans TaxID=173 RepID=UPI0021593584|nr:DUF6428 family protein [Leptospira interrogans]MCR8640848.1 hypothetical protein [Leptospira interrogans serovar Ricardi]